jgi:hypothetical protein
MESAVEPEVEGNVIDVHALDSSDLAAIDKAILATEVSRFLRESTADPREIITAFANYI